MGWWIPRITKTKEEKQQSKQELWEKKEKIYLAEPNTITCPDSSHPKFTIQVTKQKPVAVCYYCSKTWILDSKEFWKGRAG